jgi:hypothetical protein
MDFREQHSQSRSRLPPRQQPVLGLAHDPFASPGTTGGRSARVAPRMRPC